VEAVRGHLDKLLRVDREHVSGGHLHEPAEAARIEVELAVRESHPAASVDHQKRLRVESPVASAMP
jgi:hypothetical protein